MLLLRQRQSWCLESKLPLVKWISLWNLICLLCLSSNNKYTFLFNLIFYGLTDMIRNSLLYYLERKQLWALSNISLLWWLMYKSTKFAFLTVLFFLQKLLTLIGLVLIRMIEPLESCVAKDAFLSAAETSLLIIVFALFWQVEKVIWRSPMIKRFVSIYAMVPVVVFTVISAVLCLISV